MYLVEMYLVEMCPQINGEKPNLGDFFWEKTNLGDRVRFKGHI